MIQARILTLDDIETEGNDVLTLLDTGLRYKGMKLLLQGDGSNTRNRMAIVDFEIYLKKLKDAYLKSRGLAMLECEAPLL